MKNLILRGADIHFYRNEPLKWAKSCTQPHIIKYMLSQESKIYWLTHSDKKVREIYEEFK